jgi:large subunit ribosomal protein L32
MSICPKNKSSKARRDKRRANWKMTVPGLVKCSKCGALMMPHRVCKACGSYNKKEIKAQKKTFQREPLDEKSFFHFSELLSRDDFFLIIGTASLAYSVWHHKRSTLAALYQARNCHLPVCSTLVTSCF